MFSGFLPHFICWRARRFTTCVKTAHKGENAFCTLMALISSLISRVINGSFIIKEAAAPLWWSGSSKKPKALMVDLLAGSSSCFSRVGQSPWLVGQNGFRDLTERQDEEQMDEVFCWCKSQQKEVNHRRCRKHALMWTENEQALYNWAKYAIYQLICLFVSWLKSLIDFMSKWWAATFIFIPKHNSKVLWGAIEVVHLCAIEVWAILHLQFS